MALSLTLGAGFSLGGFEGGDITLNIILIGTKTSRSTGSRSPQQGVYKNYMWTSENPDFAATLVSELMAALQSGDPDKIDKESLRMSNAFPLDARVWLIRAKVHA